MQKMYRVFLCKVLQMYVRMMLHAVYVGYRFFMSARQLNDCFVH